jgi:hypothetical protein
VRGSHSVLSSPVAYHLRLTSARLLGRCSSLASVSGPLQIRSLFDELPSTATLEVVIRPLNQYPGTVERKIALFIHDVFHTIIQLHQFPRTLVQIVIQAEGSTEEQHGVVASYFNATSLALMESSLPMQGVVFAATVYRDAHGRFSSFTEATESQSYGTFAFAFSKSDDGILVFSDWHGPLKRNEVWPGLPSCRFNVNADRQRPSYPSPLPLGRQKPEGYTIHFDRELEKADNHRHDPSGIFVLAHRHPSPRPPFPCTFHLIILPASTDP